MLTIEQIKAAIEPKSNQLNADDLISGPITITITKVSEGPSSQQKIKISFEGDNGKPYLPCKSMIRLMVGTWKNDPKLWVGHQITIFNDPNVMYGGVKMGGIRISHITGIEKPTEIPLTTTRGRRSPYLVKPLVIEKKPEPSEAVATYPEDKFQSELPKMLAAIESGRSTVDKIIEFCEKTGPLTESQRAALSSQPETEETY